MSLTREQAAEALGMKEREIVEIERAKGGGHVVTTHDGQRTLVGSDGKVLPAEPVDVDEAVAETAEATEPPQPKGRRSRQPAKTVEKPEHLQVPEGEPAEVLAWVGDDKDRAAAAHKAELGREEPREDLAKALEELAG